MVIKRRTATGYECFTPVRGNTVMNNKELAYKVVAYYDNDEQAGSIRIMAVSPDEAIKIALSRRYDTAQTTMKNWRAIEHKVKYLNLKAYPI